MSKKIAVGVINCHDQDTYIKCKESIPDVDVFLDVHHTTHILKDVPADRDFKRYISYGGLYNVLLRHFYQSAADYIFILKSNMIITDHTIFQDYINTAKAFGTYFMSRGKSTSSYSTIEDEPTKLNLCLYPDLYNDFIFMVKGHIKSCGYMYEGYTNISNSDESNILEIYDYYHKIKNKINYLPEGFFPDTDYSLIKIRENIQAPSVTRPGLTLNTTNNKAAAYGKFFHMNQFIPGQHKKESKENAFAALENIQKIYGTNI